MEATHIMLTLLASCAVVVIFITRQDQDQLAVDQITHMMQLPSYAAIRVTWFLR